MERLPEVSLGHKLLQHEQSTRVSKEDDTLHEKCAVFGVYAPKQVASPLVYLGLSALQHRGQEASGISSSNGGIITYKGEGLVSQAYQKSDIDKLHGGIAIGHNRYATFGGKEHMQPITSEKNLVSLAHNGTLPRTKVLEAFLHRNHLPTDGLNDSEMMQRAIEYFVEKGLSIEDAVREAYPLFTGAFSLVVMTKDKLVGMRDSFGIRPLSLGTLPGGGYALSSETIGLESIGATTLRDVKPGEMVVIDQDGLHEYQLAEGQHKLDIFEVVYFSRPESKLYGKSVNEMRREMGRQLAREREIEADIVIGVPNSAVPAAAGYAEESGIRYEPDALLKNSYVHRTFIDPAPGGREEGVRRKFSTIAASIAGKRVVMIDDSIVRGPTSKVLVDMLREAGAKEVHFVVSSPPVTYPDFYGIATPTQKELIASQKTVEEIRQYIDADSLQYLSYEGMIRATGLPEEMFCTSCFTGKYPIDIGENAQGIDFSL